MSYLVTRRSNEIGVRMALGANRSSVMRMVLRESLLLVAIGLVIGVPAASAGDRLVSSMLFGLRANDFFSFCLAIALLLAVAAPAGFLPARRASRVDPVVALRHE